MSFKIISSRQLAEKDIIDYVVHKLKNDPIMIEQFKKYKVPISEIDNIDISFHDDLDVSAKTVNGKIFLNPKMLEKGIKNVEHYLVHEVQHFLQQMTGNTDGADKKEYLSKDTEIESFKTQIKYKKENESPAAAEKYVDDLVDYHGLSGRKKQQKKKELLKD